MLIGSKLPPLRTDRTYFQSGRAAFSFLVEQVVQPEKLFLPTFTCWSLVAAMRQRFPRIKLEFYPVRKDLSCEFPAHLDNNEALVFMHYFGHENVTSLPPGEGVSMEDFSHSYYSQITPRGRWVFGSYRKVMKVADGGFVDGHFNPIYEPSRKLDSWLRLQAQDWRDVREAENMLDRSWSLSDISSQSLAVLLTADEIAVRVQRQENDRLLSHSLDVGVRHLTFRPKECPLIHNRLMESIEARDSLRKFLAKKNVFTSIHWPTHDAVKESGKNIADTIWLEQHIISIPISQDYGLREMEHICECAAEWKRGGA